MILIYIYSNVKYKSSGLNLNTLREEPIYIVLVTDKVGARILVTILTKLNSYQNFVFVLRNSLNVYRNLSLKYYGVCINPPKAMYFRRIQYECGSLNHINLHA